MKVCQDLGVFTGVVDSWSAKNSYSGLVCVWLYVHSEGTIAVDKRSKLPVHLQLHVSGF